MGMELTIRFEGDVPRWSAVCERLEAAGCALPSMRMIDGEIALPDEAPPDGWRELRVAASDGSGMVTLQCADSGDVKCVVWGNASETLQQHWRMLAWAFAQAGGGAIEAAGKRYTSADFAEAMDLPI